MRVLVVTPFYSPDLGPSAALYEMLCEELVRLNCEVSVISALPHYPTGRVAPEFRGRLVRRERIRGVDVTRVWVPSLNRSRLGQRLLGFFCFQLLAALVGLRRRYDVLIVSSPALEVFLPALALALFRSKPLIYSVHEIYPDIGVKLGIFRSPFVVKVIGWMERFCCRRARYVRVLSEGYKRALESKGVPVSKLVLIWDWIDTDFIRPLPRRNSFSAHWGLDHHFVVMYAGNLGRTQGLEQVLEAARLLQPEPRIRFVLVGDGAARETLRQSAELAGLTNVQFIPFQERPLLPWVLASADISLNTLKRGMGTDSVPSKCYSIMASGRPIIAAVDADSDTWNLVRAADCGLCVEPESPRALVGAILELYRDEPCRTRSGAQGREYVVAHHSKTHAAGEFHRLALATTSREMPAFQSVA